MTWAPFAGLGENGLRVRLSGGHGNYTYSGARSAGGGSPQLVKFEGAVSFADLLFGYQQQVGPLTVKVYGGLAAEQRGINPVDVEALASGAGLGGKAVLETWWHVGDRAWASLDLSYATIHDSHAGRLRMGWRITPSLSVGPELSVAGNVDGEVGRAGAFLRFEWAGGEISASGGLMTDWAHIERTETDAAFAIISWMGRF